MNRSKLIEKFREEGILKSHPPSTPSINGIPCYNNTKETIITAVLEIVEHAKDPVDLIERLWSIRHLLEEAIEECVYQVYPEAKVEFDKQFD